MSADLSLEEMQKAWHGSIRSYVIGFIGSLILTGIAFTLVNEQYLQANTLIYTISALAFTQAIIQLIFFLNLGKEEDSHWEMVIFFFMVLVLLIIVLGSLWIMSDLEYRMMRHNTSEMHHD
ncbi:MAG: cytochrome o ubiquinol oxidase subunit IV [Chlamydiota bacterium]|nr:cytochrome o ubiquinol oxidase subunit IV [Chlamydiota bacterium]